MNKKFTPGPWLAEDWCKAYRKYNSECDGVFCFEIGENGGSPMVEHDKEHEANGRLVLAAPELLEALENCRKVNSKILSDGGCDYNLWFDDVVEAQVLLSRAIRKAYGQQTP